MAVGLRWYREAGGRIYVRRDRETGETVHVQAPIVEKVDFTRGSSTVALTSGWNSTASGGAASVGVVDQTTTPTTTGHGVARLTSDTANTGTNSYTCIYLGNSERLLLGATTTPKYNSFEARLTVTKNTTMNYQNVFVGFCGGGDIPAAGTGIKTLNTLVGFFIGDTSGTNYLPGDVNSLDITAVTGDGSNATASSCTWTAVDTSIDHTSGTPQIFRFDVQSDKTVRFYIDNVRVCSDTTFSLAAILNAYQVVQPVVYAPRTTGARNTGGTVQMSTVDVDYGSWWSIR